jgi:hypothetical protein
VHVSREKKEVRGEGVEEGDAEWSWLVGRELMTRISPRAKEAVTTDGGHRDTLQTRFSVPFLNSQKGKILDTASAKILLYRVRLTSHHLASPFYISNLPKYGYEIYIIYRPSSHLETVLFQFQQLGIGFLSCHYSVYHHSSCITNTRAIGLSTSFLI